MRHGWSAPPDGWESVIKARSATAGELLEQAAEKYGDRDLIVLSGNRYTYRTINDGVEAFASGLSRLGVKKGERVLIDLQNQIEFVYAYYATMKLGAIAVGIFPMLRAAELQYMLENTEASTIILPAGEHLKLISEMKPVHLKNVITVSQEPGRVSFAELMEDGKGKAYDRPKLDPEKDLCTLIYTSGTTGKPKGTMHTHAGFFGACTYAGQALQVNPESVVLGNLPLIHMFGAASLNFTLVSGAKYAVMETYVPDKALETIEREKATIHNGTATMFILEMNSPNFGKYDISSLKGGTGIAAGTAFPVELMRRITDVMGLRLIPAFGTSESVCFAIGFTHDSEEARCTTTGKVIYDGELKIVNPENRKQELSLGETGEAAYRGWNLCKGYWNNPDETRSAMDDEGWYYSGDLAVLDADGYVKIVGRVKENINRGGMKIHPSETEGLLIKHPKIAEGAVVGVPNPVMGEVSCACVRLMDENETLTLEEIREYLKGQVADYKLPDELLIVKDFPRSNTGKILKFGAQGLMEIARNSQREKLRR